MKKYEGWQVIWFAGLFIIFFFVVRALELQGESAVLLSFSVCGGFFLIMKIRRIKHMQKMIMEIDAILHGANDKKLSDYNEGELSLLQNEISKMTIMLRSHSEQLSKEKNSQADFMADISHQIRTPLTSLNILLATLKKTEDEEKRRSCIFEMSRQLDRIDWLVSTLLKLAKMDAGVIDLKKEKLIIEDMVKDALAPLEIMLDVKNIRIETHMQGSIIADKLWTMEAISNILKNCAEHMEDGGTIYIHSEENTIYSEITIQDTGCGIAKEDLPYIFDRFYKGKNAGNQSYGIGLSLARSIIAKQNGTVKAENCEEKGAEFTIRFYLLQNCNNKVTEL